MRGIAVPLDLNDTSDLLFFGTGAPYQDYEPELIAAAAAVLRPGDTCVDVGANRGYLSLILARLVGPSGRVHSFEPGPRSLAKFGRTIEANRSWDRHRGQILLHPFAAWDRTDEITLYSSPIDNARDSTVAHAPGAGTTVPARRIDDVLSLEGPVKVLKLDVEGAELRALVGASRLIDRSPDVTLLVEWHRAYATIPLWEWLSTRFRVSRLTPGGAVPVTRPRELAGIQTLACTRF